MPSFNRFCHSRPCRNIGARHRSHAILHPWAEAELTSNEDWPACLPMPERMATQTPRHTKCGSRGKSVCGFQTFVKNIVRAETHRPTFHVSHTSCALAFAWPFSLARSEEHTSEL